jgi:hypothetical protein
MLLDSPLFGRGIAQSFEERSADLGEFLLDRFA